MVLGGAFTQWGMKFTMVGALWWTFTQWDDGQLVGLDDWCQRLDDSGGSYTGKLCLAHWFGSDWPARGPGRGVWRRDELTLCLLLSAPPGSIRAGRVDCSSCWFCNPFPGGTRWPLVDLFLEGGMVTTM